MPAAFAHRLRAMAHLARNIALLSCLLSMIIGAICVLSSTYREGLAGGGTPLHPSWPSPSSWWMILISVFGGATMLLFELFTFARADVLVMPWLWGARIVVYCGLAFPAIMNAHELMPPILPAVGFGLAAMFNMIALASGALPNAKEWSWRLLGSGKRERHTISEGGGKYVSLAETVINLPRDIYLQGRTSNMLPRYVFLCLYSSLNLALWINAYSYHANTPKGRALRGEDYLACFHSRGIVTQPVNSSGGPVSGVPGTVTGQTRLPCPHAFAAGQVLVAGSELLKQVGTGKWFPIAKAFGQLLNLNCAVMVLPVIRSAVMWLHDATSMHAPWYLKWVPYVLQLDKNVVFHKVNPPFSNLSLVPPLSNLRITSSTR